MTKQEQLIIILLILAALLGTGLLYYRKFQETTVKPEVVEAKDIKELRSIVVEIKGACWRPGVYTLSDGTRVKEAIEQAGPRPDASLDNLNLARRLKDGESIFIPPGPLATVTKYESRQEEIDGPGPVSAPSAKLDLNQARSEELEKLPGIGPKLAASIVAYRNTHGRFKNIDEIKKVDKIGEGVYKKIKDSITVEGGRKNAQY